MAATSQARREIGQEIGREIRREIEQETGREIGREICQEIFAGPSHVRVVMHLAGWSTPSTWETLVSTMYAASGVAP